MHRRHCYTGRRSYMPDPHNRVHPNTHLSDYSIKKVKPFGDIFLLQCFDRHI